MNWCNPQFKKIPEPIVLLIVSSAYRILWKNTTLAIENVLCFSARISSRKCGQSLFCLEKGSTNWVVPAVVVAAAVVAAVVVVVVAAAVVVVVVFSQLNSIGVASQNCLFPSPGQS